MAENVIILLLLNLPFALPCKLCFFHYLKTCRESGKAKKA